MSALSALWTATGYGEPWVYDVYIRKLTSDGHTDPAFPRLTRQCSTMQLTKYGFVDGPKTSRDPTRAWKVTVAAFMAWLHEQLPGIMYKRTPPAWRLQGVVPTARNVFVPRGVMTDPFDEPEDSDRHLWECMDSGAQRFARFYTEDVQFVCELFLVKQVRLLSPPVGCRMLSRGKL